MVKKMDNHKKFWQMKLLSKAEAEIYIDGEIDDIKWDDSTTTNSSFRNDLKELGDVDTINLHINSPGGSVFEGIAIFNQLKQHKAKINVYVDGLAASIASVIAMSGDAIFMPENAMLMIHNPWTVVRGNADELRKQADDLDRIGDLSVKTYLSKADGKISEEKLKQLMDEETWLTAQEAIDYGLADELLPINTMVASVDEKFMREYKNIPQQLKQKTSVSKERLNMAKIAEERIKTLNIQLGGIE